MTKPIPDEITEEARKKRLKMPERMLRPPHKRSRLPNGAHLEATYDATEARWTGSLRVGDIVAEADCGGIMTLLSVLDLKLRTKLGIDLEGAPVEDLLQTSVKP